VIANTDLEIERIGEMTMSDKCKGCGLELMGFDTCQGCGFDNAITENSKKENAMPWKGKLHHDTSDYSDWGWIRDEGDHLVIEVKIPFGVSDEEKNMHRKNRTDPTQKRVDEILKALN